MSFRSARFLAVPIVALSLSASTAAAQTADDLFDNAVLHRIDLYVNSRDWRQLKTQWQENVYVPANLAWRGNIVRNVGLRSRGSGSRSENKLGLRVDFNRYTAGQTFLGLKSVILDNLTQDPTNIRETTAFTFLRRMGIPVSREAHAVVYVNNAYYGLFALVEEVDTVALSRWFGDSEGYLFEYRWLFDYWLTDLGADLDVYAQMFSPKTHELDALETLYGPIEEMIRAINGSGDESFVAAVSQYLDLPLFLRELAIQDFLAELDGLAGAWGLNNFYLYRFPNGSSSQFILWDADNSFIQLEYPLLRFHDRNVLIRRALSLPEFQQLYFDTLEQCAVLASETDGEDSRGWLEREIQRQQDLVHAAALQDRSKPFTNDEFEQASAEILRFGQARAAFVRCEVGKRLDPRLADADCTPPPAAPVVIEPVERERRATRVRIIR